MRVTHWCWTWVLLGASLTMPGHLAWAQRGRPMPLPPPVQEEPIPGVERPSTRKMVKASYEQLQKDVQHLSDLAEELKTEVTNSGENVLSLSGVKKAEEIEKLAKKIQSRMKNL
jgi:hypothetical protein